MSRKHHPAPDIPAPSAGPSAVPSSAHRSASSSCDADPARRDAPLHRGTAVRSGPDRRTAPRVGRVASVPPARQVVGEEAAPAPSAHAVPSASVRSFPADPPEDGRILAGRNPIREALRAGRSIERLLVARGSLSGPAREIVRLAREAGAVVQEVDRSRLDRLYPAHQGLLAYMAAVNYVDLDALFDRAACRGEDPFFVLLDGVTDPHNLGAILRTAECAGAHGAILPERRAAGLGPAAAKAAAGALDCLPVARVTNLHRTIDELRSRGVWVCATALSGEDALRADLSGPIALVIGSEGEGVSQLTLQKCDRVLTLPMRGQLTSLNASVAAGILMYEVLRARSR